MWFWRFVYIKYIWIYLTTIDGFFLGGFGSYLFGMSEIIAKQSHEANAEQNTKNPSLVWMIAFLFVVSFLGLFSVVPLRKVHLVINNPVSLSVCLSQSERLQCENFNSNMDLHMLCTFNKFPLVNNIIFC